MVCFSKSGRGSSPASDETGSRRGRRADSDVHTSGRATTPGGDRWIALVRHSMTPQAVCSRSPPRPPTQDHPGAAAGNPDASRSFAGRPATGPHRMGRATAAARLVSPAGGALGVVSGLLRTVAGTVDLAAVAAAADEHLSLAADTQEQPPGRLVGLSLVRAWTTSTKGAKPPPHACGARRRSRLGGAPIRIAVHMSHVQRGRPLSRGLWLAR